VGSSALPSVLTEYLKVVGTSCGREGAAGGRRGREARSESTTRGAGGRHAPCPPPTALGGRSSALLWAVAWLPGRPGEGRSALPGRRGGMSGSWGRKGSDGRRDGAHTGRVRCGGAGFERGGTAAAGPRHPAVRAARGARAQDCRGRRRAGSVLGAPPAVRSHSIAFPWPRRSPSGLRAQLPLAPLEAVHPPQRPWGRHQPLALRQHPPSRRSQAPGEGLAAGGVTRRPQQSSARKTDHPHSGVGACGRRAAAAGARACLAAAAPLAAAARRRRELGQAGAAAAARGARQCSGPPRVRAAAACCSAVRLSNARSSCVARRGFHPGGVFGGVLSLGLAVACAPGPRGGWHRRARAAPACCRGAARRAAPPGGRTEMGRGRGAASSDRAGGGRRRGAECKGHGGSWGLGRPLTEEG
jgi:hypothetical protein